MSCAFSLCHLPLPLFLHLKIIIWHFYRSLRGNSLIYWPSPQGGQSSGSVRAALLELVTTPHLAQGHFSKVEACQGGAWRILLLTSLTSAVLGLFQCFALFGLLYHLHILLSFLIKVVKPQYCISPGHSSHNSSSTKSSLLTPPRGAKSCSLTPLRGTLANRYGETKRKRCALKIRQCGKRKMSSVSSKRPNHKLLLETWRWLIMGINCTAWRV